jgi:Autographiviridae DNA polymerase
MSYVVWDEETTIKVHNKRKASPFGGVNHVVASGWKRKGMAHAVGEYFGRLPPTGDWFTKLLQGTKMLVGFNIKFDLLHALNTSKENYDAWVDWVANGGQVWDGQLAEYLLHGMAREQHMLSLDEVAPRYGGHLKNDAVKALWEAGVDTPDIDRDLLMEYLIGAQGEAKDLGDIGNTELVFLGQVQALRARGSLQSVLLNMGSLLCTIEMEYRGMRVDKDLGLRLAAELEIRLSQLRTDLSLSLPADLPFEFNWGSRFHLSALVFGGKVKYQAKAIVVDDEGRPVYYQMKEKHYVLTDGSTTATPPQGADVFKYATFAGGKNKGEYKTKQVTTPDIARGPKDRYEDFLYEFDGYTEPSPQWESSTPGVYSVAADVIEALGNRDIPFLQALAAMSALNKDLGTYYITTDEESGEQKGMLTLVDTDGIVHHSLNHVNTVTGRFSSSNPNLQNVSGAGKSDVKSLFISRYPDGYIIQSDFTALEIYVQAILTMCRQLIEDLKQGLDMHCVRVAQKTGRSYDEVYAAYKEGDKAVAKQRKGAKEFSFQRAYGSGVANIVATTGMTTEDVEALIAAEAERYPEVDAFYIKLHEQIIRSRVPTNRFVQHPDVPGLTCQLGRSHYMTPDKKMYSYSEQPAPSWLVKRKGQAPQSFSPTEEKNYIVQGTGGEWAKAAMWLLVRAFYAVKNFGGLAVLVNQVHDANYADADTSVATKAAALMHACMDEASTLMEKQFNWIIPLPVPTETKYGRSMIEENDMPDGFKDQVQSYRKWVRDTFIDGYVPSYERIEDNGI